MYIQIYSYIIATLVSNGHQWGLVNLICLSLHLFVQLSTSLFGDQSAARTCVRRMEL